VAYQKILQPPSANRLEAMAAFASLFRPGDGSAPRSRETSRSGQPVAVSSGGLEAAGQWGLGHNLQGLPSGKLTYLLKMAIYS